VFQAAGYISSSRCFPRKDALARRLLQGKRTTRRPARAHRETTTDYLRSLEMTLSIAPFDTSGRKRIAPIDLENPISSTSPTRPVQRKPRSPAVQSQSRCRQHCRARLEDMFGDKRHDFGRHLPAAGPALGNRHLDHVVPRCSGRRVEETILQHLVQQARAAGISETDRALHSDRQERPGEKTIFSKLGFYRDRTRAAEWRDDHGS